MAHRFLILLFPFFSFLYTVLGGPVCTEIVLNLTITANNADLSPNLNTAGLLKLLTLGMQLSFTFPINGAYQIAGTYCEPEVNVPSRRNTLQLLAHPATYDRKYWFGGYGRYEEYSWVSFASSQGYPTFAIDRLGNGNSSHPDGTLVVQCPAQAATIHEIILLARNGTLPIPTPRPFNNIIFVGESLGSLVGNFVNVLYPTDIDATLLQGFSREWVTVIPGFTLTAALLPTTLTPSYLTPTSQPGTEFLLFFGPGTSYNRTIIVEDYLHRGTITLGEAASGALVPVARNYKGDVLVVTGQKDTVFCGSLGLKVLGPGDCGDCGVGDGGKLAVTRSVYPVAGN